MNDKPEYREVNFRDNAQYSHTGDNVGRDKIEYYFYGSKFADRPKKKFTNKKLIIPFTKSDANEAQGGTYVPREDLLGQISDCYRSQTGKKRLVFLSGMGGCGKSELAKAYAERHSEEYNEIFWLTCKDGINQNLMGLMADAEILCMPEKEDIYRFSDKVLIIVDNCNSNNARLLTDLERATGDADILVTTRLSRIGNYRQLIPVESDDEKVFAYLVFEKNYCRISIDKAPKEIKRSDVNFINEICQDVLYNTMMVSLIAVCLREYSDYTIAEYAAKIRDGISKLEDRTKYGKDQENKDGAIKEILQFLFSDILHHKFTEAEKTVITVLSLAPASWYEMDFINSICRKADGDSGSKYALKTLQDLGWLQGHSERVSIHPLIAEVISSQDIVFRTPDFFEGLVENYLGMPDQYLGMERFMINKILSFGKSVSLEKRLAVMLLINNKEEYDKVFAELYPDVNAAYTVYVNHNGRRFFLYQDIEKNDTHQFCDVPCREEEGIQAELLRIINKGVSYSLDLSTVFYEKEIRNIPFGLCYKDSLLIGCVFSRKLETIGNRAFENCTGFSGELNLSECLVSIGDKAFEGCNKLNGELRFPKSLRSIGNRAFSGCSNLSGKLNLPDNVTHIKQKTFYGCSGLSGELKLPENLLSIGNRAFYGCSGLSGNLRFPKGVTSIGNEAFYGCSGLSGELRLSGCLTDIRGGAFSGCNGLSGKLELPNGLKSIGDNAFEGCNGLSGELRLPESLVRIGNNAFKGCSGLSGELELSNGLKRIGDNAFEDCCSLNGELKLHEGLMNIGRYAFKGCYGLSGELRLPESLVRIGNNAFEGCRSLSGELGLPKGLTRIYGGVFSCCSGLSGELRLPEGLTRIDGGAFNGCSGLSGELSILNGVKQIGRSAFEGCRSLSGSLRLPEGLTTISKRAFYDCSGLSGELILPASLTSIGGNSFYGCDSIEKVIFLNANTKIAVFLSPYTSTIICGYRNSTAEEYARKQGLVFEELET